MGRKPVDLSGKVFGRLTVLNITDERIRGYPVWDCICSCGTKTKKTSDVLKRGNTKSCGCLKAESDQNNLNYRNGKHGGKQEAKSEYRTWLQLRFNHVVPKEWDDFVQFFCDVGERPSPNHVLSRKDARQPHGKENTYWRNADDERRAYDQLTTAELPDECIFDFRTYLRTAAAVKEGEAATPGVSR